MQLKLYNQFQKISEILFVPDTHLGHYVQEQIGREMIIWDGYCPTHSRIRDRDIIREKQDHPNAEIMSIPTRPENIREVSDYLFQQDK